MRGIVEYSDDKSGWGNRGGLKLRNIDHGGQAIWRQCILGLKELTVSNRITHVANRLARRQSVPQAAYPALEPLEEIELQYRVPQSLRTELVPVLLQRWCQIENDARNNEDLSHA